MSSGLLRESVRNQVALCSYIADVDTRRTRGEAEQYLSLRAAQWKLRRQLQSSENEASSIEGDVEEQSAPSNSELDIHNNNSPSTSSQVDDGCDDDVLSFTDLMNKVIAHDVDIHHMNGMESKSSDPLAVISVPSKREGFSFTLCSYDGIDLLVVFGGRTLLDVTKLLPHASVIELLKLERVRYKFSSAVYSYTVQSSSWKLQQCSGKPPNERSDHTALFLQPQYLAVCGGRGRNGQIFSDLFVLSLPDWHWTEVDMRAKLSHRYWHAWCTSGDHIYVFGGKSDVQVHGDLQQFHASRLVQALQKYDTTVSNKVGAVAKRPSSTLNVEAGWSSPHTVGEPPSARFGMRVLALDHDQIGVIGGWHASWTRGHVEPVHAQRSVDLFILDTMTMVWTKPRLSSHVCGLSAPSERFNFDCFYAFNTVIIHGGYTYSTNGSTESFSARNDRSIIYKLDVHRMIWRRHHLTEDELDQLASSQSHYCCNNLRAQDEEKRALVCSNSDATLLLALTSFTISLKRTNG